MQEGYPDLMSIEWAFEVGPSDPDIVIFGDIGDATIVVDAETGLAWLLGQAVGMGAS